MKYIINAYRNGVNLGYISCVHKNGTFDSTQDINKARKFSSESVVHETIDTLTWCSGGTLSFGYSPIR